MSAIEIPEDIIDVSYRVWVDCLRDGTPDSANIIARAILAERERCFSVARSEAEKRLENGDGYPAYRVHDFLVVARAIESGIRNPKL